MSVGWRLLRLKQFTRTFIATAPLLCLFGVLLSVILYTFALLGMDLFGHMIVHPEAPADPGSSFATFGNAMLVTIELLLNQNLGGTFWLAVCRGWKKMSDLTFKYRCFRTVGGWMDGYVGRFHASVGQTRPLLQLVYHLFQFPGRHLHRQVRTSSLPFTHTDTQTDLDLGWLSFATAYIRMGR